MGRRRVCGIASLALVVAALAACGDSSNRMTEPVVEPFPEPRDTTPLQGLSRARLYALSDRLAGGQYGAVDALIVQRHGERVIEEYYRGYDSITQHSLQSVTKSFASALLGIAIDKGFIEGVDERVMDFFPQWEADLGQNALRSAMRLEDILTMRTGSSYNEVGADAPHWELNRLATGWDRFWLSQSMIRQPGTFWQYDSGGVIALSSVMRFRAGEHANTLAEPWLFVPLGIDDKTWFTNQEGHPHLGGGLSLTPRHMVKLGQLYLQMGEWEGRQIVSREWVEASTRRHVDFGVPEGSSQKIRWYGYLWWILQPDPNGAGVQDIYAAVGAGGQFIFVIPEHDMVVAVTSDVQTGQQWTPVEWLYSDVLTALIR